MTLDIRELHPLFAAEIRGVDLADPATDALYPEFQAALDKLRRAGLPRHADVPGPPDRRSAGCSGRWRARARMSACIKTGFERRLETRLADISNLDEGGAVLGQQDRRRMFALGNQLWHTDSSFKAIPAKYSAAARPFGDARGRRDPVRRYPRGLGGVCPSR